MKEEKISALGEIECELSTVYLCPVGGMLLFSDEEHTPWLLQGRATAEVSGQPGACSGNVTLVSSGTAAPRVIHTPKFLPSPEQPLFKGSS